MADTPAVQPSASCSITMRARSAFNRDVAPAVARAVAEAAEASGVARRSLAEAAD